MSEERIIPLGKAAVDPERMWRVYKVKMDLMRSFDGLESGIALEACLSAALQICLDYMGGPHAARAMFQRCVKACDDLPAGSA